MSGLLGDVAALEQHGLVEVAVEIRLHPRVADIGRPADEMRDGALRTVCVVYLQPVAALSARAASFVKSAHGSSYPSMRSPTKLYVE